MTRDELKVEVQLLNRNHKNSLLVVKARKVGENTHCDIGILTNGEFEPMIETKIIEKTSPAEHHLVGAVRRLERVKGKEIEGNLRLRMAVSFLSTAVSKLFD